MTPPKPRKTCKCPDIPEEQQKPWRERLELLRHIRKLRLSDIGVISGGTLRSYERVDLARAQLGTLMALAEFYEMSIQDFMKFLLGEDVPIRTANARTTDEVLLYLNHAEPETQEVIRDVVRVIARRAEDKKLADIKIQHRPPTRRTPAEKGVLITE